MWTFYFTPVVSSFFIFFSPILSRRRLDVYHTSTHDVALVRIYNAGLKCAVRVLSSLLHRRHSMEDNHTLHDVWPSPGLVHYIHFWGLLPPNGILSGAKFTLRPDLAFSYIDSVTARHSSSDRQPNFATWCLHATGRPSRSTLGGRTV